MSDRSGIKKAAVIVAAGKGLRAGTAVPKQYLILGGKPVLRYSVEAFLNANAKVVAVVPAGDEAYVRDEILKGLDVVIVPGGAERHDSVYNGLKAAADSDYVWIHDAARPLVPKKVIEETMAAAVSYGAAVPVLPVKDTVYVMDDNKTLESIPDRSSLRAAQTPQTFRTELAIKAHEALRKIKDKGLNVTDDVMLVKILLGAPVRLVDGAAENFKITTPEDIEMAENTLKKIRKKDAESTEK